MSEPLTIKEYGTPIPFNKDLFYTIKRDVHVMMLNCIRETVGRIEESEIDNETRMLHAFAHGRYADIIPYSDIIFSMDDAHV